MISHDIAIFILTYSDNLYPQRQIMSPGLSTGPWWGCGSPNHTGIEWDWDSEVSSHAARFQMLHIQCLKKAWKVKVSGLRTVSYTQRTLGS